MLNSLWTTIRDVIFIYVLSNIGAIIILLLDLLGTNYGFKSYGGFSHETLIIISIIPATAIGFALSYIWAPVKPWQHIVIVLAVLLSLSFRNLLSGSIQLSAWISAVALICFTAILGGILGKIWKFHIATRSDALANTP